MDPTPEGPEPRRRHPSPWTATPRARLGLLPTMVPVLLTAMLWTPPGTPVWAATPVPFDPQANAEAAAPPEGVAVYRCRGAKGGIEFRDDPCPPGTQGESLVVEDHPTGWTPTPAPSASRTSTGQKAKAGTKAGRGKGKGSAQSARERQEESCRKKRQQVEDIDRKLRLGTKVRQGTELRHRRSVIEEYLDAHCD